MQFTKEQLQKAMACKTAEELLALAKAEGIAMTCEEAEKYLAQLATRELSVDELQGVSGGMTTTGMPDTKDPYKVLLDGNASGC